MRNNVEYLYGIFRSYRKVNEDSWNDTFEVVRKRVTHQNKYHFHLRDANPGRAFGHRSVVRIGDAYLTEADAVEAYRIKLSNSVKQAKDILEEANKLLETFEAFRSEIHQV